jgi:hypothetical protein
MWTKPTATIAADAAASALLVTLTRCRSTSVPAAAPTENIGGGDVRVPRNLPPFNFRDARVQGITPHRDDAALDEEHGVEDEPTRPWHERRELLGLAKRIRTFELTGGLAAEAVTRECATQAASTRTTAATTTSPRTARLAFRRRCRPPSTPPYIPPP